LSTTFNPSGPSLERVLAKFGRTAVPVNGHEVHGAKDRWPEKTEFQLSLKESDGFLKMTATTQQGAQLCENI